MYTAKERNPPTVKITAAQLCEVHGWVPRHEYPVLNRPINVPDVNGYEIWVESSRDKRPVWLAPNEYELISQPA
jgi:hypothetical protein